jgi:hypothetical protein
MSVGGSNFPSRGTPSFDADGAPITASAPINNALSISHANTTWLVAPRAACEALTPHYGLGRGSCEGTDRRYQVEARPVAAERIRHHTQ